jgi:hypothetical protein
MVTKKALPKKVATKKETEVRERSKRKEGANVSEPVKAAEAVVEALTTINKKVLDWQRVVTLTSDIECENAQKVLVALKEQINEADDERKKIVEPLNGVVKHVNAKVGEYTKPRKALEEHLKRLIGDFINRRREEAVKLIEKEAQKAEKQGAEQLAMDLRERAATSMPVVLNAAVRTREQWCAEVQDPMALIKEAAKGNQLALQCVVVDEAALKKIAGEGVTLPGVRFYRDVILAVTA